MSSSPRRAGLRSLFALFLLLGLGIGAATEGIAASAAQTELQLEVIINDIPADKIGSFVLRDNGRIAATAVELLELGLKPNAVPSDDNLIDLDALPSATYRYDEKTQRLLLKIDNEQRLPRDFDLSGRRNPITPSPAAYGAVLNYNLLGSFGDFDYSRYLGFEGASLSVDGRAFSPFGTLDQSAFFALDRFGNTHAFRLNSTFRYSDTDRLISYDFGDSITGFLPWARPIRIGGFQVQRNFGLRPDLITVPLPSLSATANVPSTVDVYVNNVRTFSETVSPGPFSVSNIPLISGPGNASIVVRDATGRETATTVPFYSSPYLLARGLTNFSFAVGFPRLAYGGPRDTYANTLVSSATLRKGVYDWLTFESHAEAGGGLANGGLGAILRLGQYGLVSGAASASTLNGKTGSQGFIAFESQLLGISFNGSSLRRLGDYEDLASVTAITLPGQINFLPGFFGPNPDNPALPTGTPLRISIRPPKALDRITMSTRLPFDTASSIGASFVNVVDGAGATSRIASASWSRQLPFGAVMFASAFSDFGDRKNHGIFAGITIPMFGNAAATASVSNNKLGSTYNLEAIKPVGPEIGSVGWQLRNAEGALRYRDASVSYRSPYALVRAGISQLDTNIRGRFEVEGAIAAMAGNTFLANRINDAFAVVRVGAPRVPVYYENRLLGETNNNGSILIPYLRSFDRNQISIDTTALPVDAEVGTVRNIVAPADRAGVVVDFAVKTDTRSALVVFVWADGSFVPVGSTGLTSLGSPFVIGYDGEAFLTGLDPKNSVFIDTPDGRQCEAAFDYTPKPGEQVVISPVVCAEIGVRFERTPPLILRGPIILEANRLILRGKILSATDPKVLRGSVLADTARLPLRGAYLAASESLPLRKGR